MVGDRKGTGAGDRRVRKRWATAGIPRVRLSAQRIGLEEGFVAKDSVKGGATDGELTRGAEFVAVIKVEDVLDVVADYGVEGEVFWLPGSLLV